MKRQLKDRFTEGKQIKTKKEKHKIYIRKTMTEYKAEIHFVLFFHLTSKNRFRTQTEILIFKLRR